MNKCSSLSDMSPLSLWQPRSLLQPGQVEITVNEANLSLTNSKNPHLGHNWDSALFSSVSSSCSSSPGKESEGRLLHQGRTSQPQLGWPLRLPSALHGLLRAAQQALCMLCIALHRLRGNPDPAKSMVIGPAAAMGMGPRDISYKARIFLIFHIATWNWQCRLKHGHCKKGHLALRQYKYHNLTWHIWRPKSMESAAI